MKSRFTRLRGMPDLTPAGIAPWQQLEAVVRQVMRAYSYEELRTPLIERTSLFERSIGEATDIVEKEMYTFKDRNDESLTLRPENTAGCVRAALENGLLQPGSVNRIWYTGPMFRYERPQLGRQRQFFQTGAEVYGLAGPAIEAELILLSARLWRELGIFNAVQLEVNTLGDSEDRGRFREQLVDYFQAHRQELDDDSLRRLERNPLRILDSKNPDMQTMIKAAPSLHGNLSSASAEHYAQLLDLLSSQGITVTENRRLVRGLDYYSHTVFEWTTDKLGAQSAICAGGRYDGLLEQLGAKAMPGVGWAFGMERVVALMDNLQQSPEAAVPDVFVIASNEVSSAESLLLAEHIRMLMPQASVLHNTGAGSLKSQFRKADKSGARVTVVLGADELEQSTVSVKPMLKDEPQTTISREALAGTLERLLADSL
ncbi:MAG: histidine--tRNA ligase [Granulosicoccus sp.]|nr:histidine--tRNA ligase [Granulosicoccus sp.]